MTGRMPRHLIQLLKWLAREFLVSGYDLKHVARLIMNSTLSKAGVTIVHCSGEAGERVYAGPARRRLSAEQVVDSLFAVAGKEMGVEPLTLISMVAARSRHS